ncbi:MAG: hypothetical protein PHW86_03655 [Candidatus Bipolaricaulis sp.]|nr:hypothetical protein [Candidatus Bipolaricaulis sp.]
MSLDARLARLEEKARARTRPDLGPFVLIEGKDGTAEEILARCEAEIAAHCSGPLIIFAGPVKPEDPPLPSGVIRFDPEDADL